MTFRLSSAVPALAISALVSSCNPTPQPPPQAGPGGTAAPATESPEAARVRLQHEEMKKAFSETEEAAEEEGAEAGTSEG